MLRVHHMLIIYFSWPTFVTRKVVASHEPLQVCLHGARELSRSEHLPELFDAAGAQHLAHPLELPRPGYSGKEAGDLYIESDLYI